MPTMYDIVQATVLTMQELRSSIDKWVMPPPADFEANVMGLDPGDECDCGQCRARAELQDLYHELRRRYL